MKDIRPALRAYLLADGDISAAVGAARVYPLRLPQQAVTEASIVYTVIGEVTDYHMQGSSGLVQDRIQIDCWARTLDAAVSLANLVKDRLSGLRGAIPMSANSPSDQIEIRGVFADQAAEDYDDVAKLYRRRRDYFFWYADR